LNADVVIPIYRQLEVTRRCIESVLAHSGERLGWVWLVNDRSPEPEMSGLLRSFRTAHANVRVFENRENLGFVRSANLGLAASGPRHVVLLNSDTRVTPGWLTGLIDALESEPRIAAVSPLSNDAGMCSVPRYSEHTPPREIDFEVLQLSGLPQTTQMPTAHGFCMAFKREALAEFGFFDPAYGRGYHEENDWSQRVRAAGWKVVRANRVFVFHEGAASFGAERNLLDARNAWRLVGRYPAFFRDAARFDASPFARLASRAVRASLGTLRFEMGTSNDDFELLRAGESGGATAAHVARVEGGETEAVLRALLGRVQGAIAPESLHAGLHRINPNLRLAFPGQLSHFLKELALRPDVDALSLQPIRP